MNKIISTINATIGGESVNAVNARELWVFLNVKTQFKDWITRRIEEYGFEEGKDFSSILSKSKGRPSKDYIISLDMAKELAMVENNDRGRQARQYFIEIERNSRRIEMAVNNQIAAIIPI
ncbi:MAG: antA/AntB antirepressor family protein, partial [Ruthenibacterium sp.]